MLLAAHGGGVKRRALRKRRKPEHLAQFGAQLFALAFPVIEGVNAGKIERADLGNLVPEIRAEHAVAWEFGGGCTQGGHRSENKRHCEQDYTRGPGEREEVAMGRSQVLEEVWHGEA